MLRTEVQPDELSGLAEGPGAEHGYAFVPDFDISFALFLYHSDPDFIRRLLLSYWAENQPYFL